MQEVQKARIVRGAADDCDGCPYWGTSACRFCPNGSPDDPASVSVYCSEPPTVSALTRTRLLCDRKASERGRRLYRAAARAGKYAGVFYGGY